MLELVMYRMDQLADVASPESGTGRAQRTSPHQPDKLIELYEVLNTVHALGASTRSTNSASEPHMLQ